MTSLPHYILRRGSSENGQFSKPYHPPRIDEVFSNCGGYRSGTLSRLIITARSGSMIAASGPVQDCQYTTQRRGTGTGELINTAPVGHSCGFSRPQQSSWWEQLLSATAVVQKNETKANSETFDESSSLVDIPSLPATTFDWLFDCFTCLCFISHEVRAFVICSRLMIYLLILSKTYAVLGYHKEPWKEKWISNMLMLPGSK